MTIKEAGMALSVDRARPLHTGLERLPQAPGLCAVHGARRVWGELGLEKPPDDRPLHIGRTDTPVPSELRAQSGLSLAAWKTGDCDLQRPERELCRRWQPPLR
jgi:hypothetical protein